MEVQNVYLHLYTIINRVYFRIMFIYLHYDVYVRAPENHHQDVLV